MENKGSEGISNTERLVCVLVIQCVCVCACILQRLGILAKVGSLFRL